MPMLFDLGFFYLQVGSGFDLDNEWMQKKQCFHKARTFIGHSSIENPFLMVSTV